MPNNANYQEKKEMPKQTLERNYMPSILIKFGEKKFMEDLIYNGTIYFNTIEYFRKCEQKERGDSFEGTIELRNYTEEDDYRLTITLPDSGKQFSSGKFNYRKFLSDIRGNMYCLYSLNKQIVSQQSKFEIDQRMKKFGDTMVVITRPIDFLSAIIEQLKAKGIEYTMKPMNYYDHKSFSGKLDLFSKPDTHKHQNEFRIVLFDNSTEALPIQIGNIESYAHLVPASAIDNAEIGIHEVEL